VTGIREKKKLSEAAVPPWVGYNEEELMKTQILGLSKVLNLFCWPLVDYIITSDATVWKFEIRFGFFTPKTAVLVSDFGFQK